MEIKQVGVVGCGIMGSGIAQVCAQKGFRVTVSEINQNLLDKGMAAIGSRLARDVEKGKLSSQDKENILNSIKPTTNMEDFSNCDLVIEAIVENIDLKKKVFSNLDDICPKHTILATNTSVLSVIEIGSVTKRQDKVLGLHFFNPVQVMQLLEIVRTLITSDETIKIAEEFAKTIGKSPVVLMDTPGFIVNRLHVAFTLNAIRMLESGVATRDNIDNAVKWGLNHPMGPLAIADLAGIDTLYYIACDLYEKFKEPQYAPPILLQKMFAAGWWGRKTGKGFYEYK